MHTTTAVLLSLIGATWATSSCSEVAGNWYCDATEQVTYSGLGGVAGSYDRVTNMDAESCTCTKSVQAFSGPLSPLDEDLSLHFRGPIQLAQFAAYTMTSSTSSSSSSSRKKKRTARAARKTHQHQQPEPKGQALGKVEKRDQYVYTLIPPIFTTSDYQQQTTATTTVETTATSSVAKTALSTQGTIIGLPSEISTALAAQSTLASSTSTSTEATTTSTITSSVAPVATAETVWQRTSYYNAAAGIVDNAVFMNNMGGVIGDNGTSGTWSPCFGNSLSYASTSGLSTASSPMVLNEVTLPSDSEVIIFSGEPCTEASCGYVADGVPAYVGFGGADKLFLFDFYMPSDPASIGSANGDMPAIWALNAQIPRSQQYGACSCWQTGCGELDLFEILSGGSDMLTTTFHSTLGNGGATSDYFVRPTTGYMKAAVVFISATKSIEILALDSDVVFGTELAYDVFEDWQQSRVSQVSLVQ